MPCDVQLVRTHEFRDFGSLLGIQASSCLFPSMPIPCTSFSLPIRDLIPVFIATASRTPIQIIMLSQNEAFVLPRVGLNVGFAGSRGPPRHTPDPIF